MPIVDMNQMLTHAYQHRYAVAALDIVSLDFLEAVIHAAEVCQAPVVVSLAESHFHHYDFELLMAATVRACQRSPAPLAIHLDHGSDLGSAHRAIRYGCNGVMVDTSQLGMQDNIACTRTVVEMARACHVLVEGELGYVPGVEGEDAERHPGELVYTSPDDALHFVRETGVDCLAVSIGTVHGRLREAPRLDFQRLAAINACTQLPLVIHGGSGLSDEDFRSLVANGVAKINYYTGLADAAAAAIHAELANNAGSGYTTLSHRVKGAVQAEAERVIRLFGGCGQAAEVIRQAEVRQPVEHVILFSSTASQEDTQTMMATGQAVLGAIPGVLVVATGTAVTADARYPYCWLIRFASEAVIKAYDRHPDHLWFADNLFRPLAADRLKIDYKMR